MTPWDFIVLALGWLFALATVGSMTIIVLAILLAAWNAMRTTVSNTRK